ncbi:MAG: phage protein GemA/Gp16 family protein [Aquabacterium sp.]
MIATPRRVVDGEGARRADLAAIHIAKKALCWDDETYRDIMFTVCRVRSSAEMDFGARKRWLAHLRACQQASGVAGGPPTRPAPVRRALEPVERKMWALWMQLADAGMVQQRSMAALEAYCKRQTGVDRLAWLNGRQQDLVVESLKRWLARDPAAKGA